MATVLVVADAGDLGVRAAVDTAARRLPAGRLRWTTGAALASAEWVHTVTPAGVGAARCGPVAGADRVWFRSASLAPVRRWADPRDGPYAAAEFTALLTSWLHLPQVGAVNRVDGTSPHGPGWPVGRWRRAAAGVGLRAAPLAGSSGAPPDPVAAGWGGARSVLVVAGRTVDADGPDEAAGCRRLAAAAGCAVLEVLFDDTARVLVAQPLAAVSSPARVDAVTDFLVAEAS